MSPQRIIGLFVLDATVALSLYAAAIVLSAVFADSGFTVVLTVFSLALSPVAFYARWRGFLSFETSDVLVFLPAILISGLLFEVFNPVIVAAIGMPFIVCGVFWFRQWIHGPSDGTTQE